MTTIFYDGNVLVADMQVTRDDGFTFNTNKIIKHPTKEQYYSYSGSVTKCLKFIDNLIVAEHWSDLAEHPLIDKDVITKALQFEDDGYGYVNDVKSALIRHPLFDKEHIKYLPSYHQSFANKILHEKGKI